MRRLLLLLAVSAGLAIAATPVVAATTFHTRETGTGLSAYFPNAVWDEDGLPDGPYFETQVEAAERVAIGEFGYEDAVVCVWHNESVTGTVTLDGTSLIAGAIQTGGSIFKTKSGYVDVMHD